MARYAELVKSQLLEFSPGMAEIHHALDLPTIALKTSSFRIFAPEPRFVNTGISVIVTAISSEDGSWLEVRKNKVLKMSCLQKKDK